MLVLRAQNSHQHNQSFIALTSLIDDGVPVWIMIDELLSRSMSHPNEIICHNGWPRWIQTRRRKFLWTISLLINPIRLATFRNIWVDTCACYAATRTLHLFPLFWKEKRFFFASKKIYYTQTRALIAAAVAYFNRVRLEAGEGVIYGWDFHNYLKLSPPELKYCTAFVHLN